MTASLQVHTIVSMPFAENTYIAWHTGSSEALVIDPGLEPDLILTFLSENDLNVAAILNTHGHADHIAGNAAMKHAFPDAPLLIGRGDEIMLTDANANLSAPFGIPLTSPPADRLVDDGETLEYGGIALDVIDLPGHSPGHVVFLHRGEPYSVFAGDTLMQASVGRGDFPGGDFELLLTGIRDKLLSLPEETIVYPGHGSDTTVGLEKRSNPFVGDEADFVG